MTHEKWNQIIDLWNSGMSIREISRRTGVSESDLGRRLLGAVEQAVRVRANVAGRQ
jgi:lambda repressor-like predicted transcriptional regulator